MNPLSNLPPGCLPRDVSGPTRSHHSRSHRQRMAEYYAELEDDVEPVDLEAVIGSEGVKKLAAEMKDSK